MFTPRSSLRDDASCRMTPAAATLDPWNLTRGPRRVSLRIFCLSASFFLFSFDAFDLAFSFFSARIFVSAGFCGRVYQRGLGNGPECVVQRSTREVRTSFCCSFGPATCRWWIDGHGRGWRHWPLIGRCVIRPVHWFFPCRVEGPRDKLRAGESIPSRSAQGRFRNAPPPAAAAAAAAAVLLGR